MWQCKRGSTSKFKIRLLSFDTGLYPINLDDVLKHTPDGLQADNEDAGQEHRVVSGDRNVNEVKNELETNASKQETHNPVSHLSLTRGLLHMQKYNQFLCKIVPHLEKSKDKKKRKILQRV